MATGNAGRPDEHLVRVRGLRINVREWTGDGRPFLLVHGLSSNARTWDGVGRHLSARGHRVVAVDQRGHGKSDKPEDGYAFEDVTADLRDLASALQMVRPIVAGQSWGGSVVIDFAARYPGAASGIILVDGGFNELSARPDATWENISVQLRPPDLDGMPAVQLEERMRARQPFMTPDRIEAAMGNFEVLDDGTVRRRLTIPNHMKILRSMWDHPLSEVWLRVREPVLIAVPEDGDAERTARKRAGLERAQLALAKSRVRWFADSVHDLHLQRPDELAEEVIGAIREGFFP